MENRFLDQMTPKERMSAFAAGQEIDRIPCSPHVGEYAAKIFGVPVRDYCHSAELMVEAQAAAFKKYRYDSVGVSPGLYGIPEAMGTKLCFPNDGVPYVLEPVVKEYSRDLDRLRTIDPYKDGRLPLYLTALQTLHKKIGHEVSIGSSIGGPFTSAMALRGTESFLKDLLCDREMIHRLLGIVTQSLLNYIDAVCDLGFRVSLSEPAASGSVIGPRQFREYVKPYLKTCIDRIIEKTGKGPSLHICGNTKRIWIDMAETGAATLSLDNVVDLAEAKAVVGDQVCISGNVRPVETMLQGERQQIIEEAKECIIKACDNPKGYILSTGCTLPLGTPPENVTALMDAARLYGRYPIDPECLKHHEQVKYDEL